ncbi:MAG: BTAD domain-containing putative transcriptional regulator [Actinomycetota bacterium]|nr:BTAD domain-containing putative transcriptional regulator [Actinomycetota bacterium]
MRERLKHAGVPDFGHILTRRRLARSIECTRPRVLILEAPGGYGKSVLAAQIASSGEFGCPLWLDMHGERVTESGILRLLLRALDSGGLADCTDDIDPNELACDYRERIVRAVRRCDSGLCVVIDDLAAIELSEGLLALPEMAATHASHALSIIITCRQVPDDIHGVLHRAMLLQAEDLRLSLEEALTFAGILGLDAHDPSFVHQVWEATAGQVALFGLVLRHAILRGTSELDECGSIRGLSSLVMHLVCSQLDDESQLCLYAMALLRDGSSQELRCVLGRRELPNLRNIGSCLPLVCVGGTAAADPVGHRFVVHDIARSILAGDQCVERLGAEAARVWSSALEILTARGDSERAGRLVLQSSDCERAADWLASFGERLLSSGHHQLLRELLDALPPGVLVQRPALLVLEAALLRETNMIDEARSKAVVARALADSMGDVATTVDALDVIARADMDMGRFDAARRTLAELLGLSNSQDGSFDPRREARVHLTAALASTYLGDGLAASEHLAKADGIASETMDEGLRCKVHLHAANKTALLDGHFSAAGRLMAEVARARAAPLSTRVLATGNLGVCLCEAGRLVRSVQHAERALEMCRGHGLEVYVGAFDGARAGAIFALGELSEGISLMRESIVRSLELDDTHAAAYNQLYCSTMSRALGDAEAAFSDAEIAAEAFSAGGFLVHESLAKLEMAASRLAMGDKLGAATLAKQERATASAADAAYHVLRADMILAEVACREGRVTEAVARILVHEDYILTESSNWQIAMYIRAFPSLLGVFANAIDPDLLPAHLLRMVLPRDAEGALRAAREIMDSGRWARLAVRILGEKELARFLERDALPRCSVKMFGGFDVSIGERVVGEREWKKRKARLLFAMLVLQQGRDVPRDQVHDHLWPEMDATRSRNNLYVVWSAMKGTLTPGAGKNDPCPYVQSVGGVCRVVGELVESDVAEFEALRAAAAAAGRAGDATKALAAYERISEIYRGDLLPGDLYEDWFSEFRDRYRHEFGDAMLAGARLHEAGGEPAQALGLLRRGLRYDSWREDIYQAALRCQIATGQRSAAIDTYFACRSRLVDDLGIDPSSETTRLYQQVLAMECVASEPEEIVEK